MTKIYSGTFCNTIWLEFVNREHSIVRNVVSKQRYFHLLCQNLLHGIDANQIFIKCSRGKRYKLFSYSIDNEVLNRLLPILYGALGATAYLLRTLIPHIRNRTFNRKLSDSITVRICLGMGGDSEDKAERDNAEEPGHPSGHSYRSASMGSRSDAFHAG